MRVKTLLPLAPKTFYPPRGEKQIFLPNFTITLLRTPHAPPHFASFLTPLYFNKLDLKDYLWNLYGLEVLGVRSYVIQARVQQDKPGSKMPVQHRWYRPRASKKMTVELSRSSTSSGPFIWPAEPTDFSAWSKNVYDTSAREKKAEEKRMSPEAATLEKEDGGMLRTQAERLLKGEERWKGKGKWVMP